MFVYNYIFRHDFLKGAGGVGGTQGREGEGKEEGGRERERVI